MHLAMCLDFSLRFQRSPGTASHLPCYLLWFRFFGSWVKFQDSADQIPPPSPLWEPELPHKMLTSGAYTRSDQKRILSSEHIIPTCTLERIMDPRVEVLRRRGYQAHFTQPREAAVCWRLFNTQSNCAHRFRTGNEEGDHSQLQPQGALEEARWGYLWYTSLPPSLKEGGDSSLLKKKQTQIVYIIMPAKAGFQK